jgi:exosortase C (VPDSG-CTERM-specific)
VIAWLGCVGLLTLLFAHPLVALMRLASENSLHSHVPLVPLIAGYLWYAQPRRPSGACRSSVTGTLGLSAIAVAALTGEVWFRAGLSGTDALALSTLAYLSFVAAGGFLFLGSGWMAAAAFPFAFLLFMVPLPDVAALWLETALVAASADVSALFFRLTGTPLFRDGLLLGLPGITLEVARECSGIRSTWVLLITSVIASRMFLDNPWRRLALVAFVIPLGIVRNALRILVIGLLAVHVGPHMVDTVIHHRGGPIFFALSLGPLFALLWWLRRGERRSTATR